MISCRNVGTNRDIYLSHLLIRLGAKVKGFPRYRRIRKQTQLPVVTYKMAANTNVSMQCMTLTLMHPLKWK